MPDKINAYAVNGNDVAKPYEKFDSDTYNYLRLNTEKFCDLGKGTYAAGSYLNTYAVRGNENGLPTIFLPGGPGSTLSSGYKKYFDPEGYKLILSDWRGAGTSKPSGISGENTTPRLVEDIEKLRVQSRSEQVVLCGTSWGLTMALCYAQHYPQKVAGIVGGAPLLASKEDVLWCYSGNGIARSIPQAYEVFRDFAKKDDPYEILETYSAAINSENDALQQEAYTSFRSWELSYRSGEMTACDAIKWGTDHAKSRMEQLKLTLHYTLNNYFLPEEGCITSPDLLANVPIIIARNDKDSSLRPDTGEILRDSFPHAELLLQAEATWHHGQPAGSIDPFIDGGFAYGLERMRRSLVCS